MQTDPFDEVRFGAGPPVNPRWTVCVPTHNRETHLVAALQSILSAIVDVDAEIVVADNASTDRTADVIAALDDSRIRLLRYSSLASMYANHNRCIDEAKGEWLMFLHSDDSLPSNFFQLVEPATRSEPQVDVVADFCRARDVMDLESLLDEADHAARGRVVAALVLAVDGGSPSGTAYRRQAFERSGAFDTDHFGADAELMVRWSIAGHRVMDLKQDKPVWEAIACSTTNDPAYRRDSWLAYRPIFKAAFDSGVTSEMELALAKVWQVLPTRQRVRLLYRLSAAGYRDYAWRVWRNGSTPLRCLTQWRLYCHVVPTIFSPRAFHQILAALAPTIKRIRDRGQLTRSFFAQNKPDA